jgi:cytochrome b561
MHGNAPANRYGRLSILLHWAMLLLIACVYATIELRTFFPKGSDLREGLKSWHFMLGLCVLALVIVRIGARLLGETPAIIPSPPRWQTFAGRGMHLLLYALMLGMPIAGWLTLSAMGKEVSFFGLGVPPLVPPDKPLAEQVKELHETGGTIGYWLVGLHAAAALFHHYVLRDDAFTRMLPAVLPRSATAGDEMAGPG